MDSASKLKLAKDMKILRPEIKVKSLFLFFWYNYVLGVELFQVWQKHN